MRKFRKIVFFIAYVFLLCSCNKKESDAINTENSVENNTESITENLTDTTSSMEIFETSVDYEANQCLSFENDFLDSSKKQLIFEDMEMVGEVKDDLYCFEYSGDVKVTIEYFYGQKGTITIDGEEYELAASGNFQTGGTPYILIYDVNNDGVVDVIIQWRLFRGIADALFLSGDNGYKEIASVNELNNSYDGYSVNYEDGFVINIRCEDFNTGARFPIMEKSIDYYAFQFYDEQGKVRENREACRIVADYAIDYYTEDSKVYICHRGFFAEGSFWSGVCMTRVYVLNGENYECVDLFLDEIAYNGW